MATSSLKPLPNIDVVLAFRLNLRLPAGRVTRPHRARRADTLRVSVFPAPGMVPVQQQGFDLRLVFAS